MRQDPVVDEKLDVRESARILLDIERAGAASRKLLAHALAHRLDLLLQTRPVNVVDEHIEALAFERLAHLGSAGDRAATQECLVLPGPRVLSLVAAETVEARHEQPGAAVGPQAHIDLIQAPRTRLYRQHVHEALHEPCKKHCVVERPEPVRFLVRPAAIVNEHQVEVRAITQFETAELAVTDDAQARGARRFAVHGHAVPRHEFAPGGVEREVEQDFRRIGQPVADLHQRQVPEAVGDRDPEHCSTLELAHGFKRGFDILGIEPADLLGHEPVQLLARRRRLEQSRIEQLVQQQGVFGDLPAQQRARTCEIQQLLQRSGILIEQRQIGAAPADRAQDRQQPGKRSGRMGIRIEHRHEVRNDIGQALPAGLVHAQIQPARSEIVEQSEHIRIGAEGRVFQRIRERARFPRGLDGRRTGTFRGRAVRGPGQAIEFRLNMPAVTCDTCFQGGPVRLAEGIRQALAQLRLGRQLLGLTVIHGLQPVLDRAQEPVILAERLRDRLVVAGVAGKQRQNGEQGPRSEQGFLTASEDLHGLGDELDLPNTARAELDVVRDVLALDARAKCALHLPERLEHPKIDIAPIHERRQDFVEQLRSAVTAGNQPRLDVGVTFPVPAVPREVGLQRRHADGERAARPEGPKPRVHPKHEAVRGDLVEQPDQALDDPPEVVLDFDSPGPGEREPVRIHEHEVDVGGKIEFPSAEFAHTEHEQFARLPVAVHGPAVARFESLYRVAHGRVDHRIGERRQIPDTVHEALPAGEVPPGEPRKLDIAAAPEHGHRLGLGQTFDVDGGEHGIALKCCVVFESCKQFRAVPDENPKHEIADDGDARDGRGDPGVRRDIELRKAFLDKAISVLESGRQTRGRRQLHGGNGSDSSAGTGRNDKRGRAVDAKKGPARGRAL